MLPTSTARSSALIKSVIFLQKVGSTSKSATILISPLALHWNGGNKKNVACSDSQPQESFLTPT